MRTIGRFYVLFFLAFNSGNAQTDNRIIEIDQILEQLHLDQRFNGNILIAEKGEILYERSFGHADFESDEKLSTTSLFNIASVSKLFTVVGIMMLEEDKLLNIKDRAKLYFPDFPYDDITIEDLLAHTAGLPRIQSQPFRKEIEGKAYSNHEIKDVFFKIAPKQHFKAGTNYYYTNTSYMLLALILEKVSKQSYNDFLVSRILNKANMRQTFLREKRVPQSMQQYLVSYYHKPFWLSENFQNVSHSERRISDDLTFANDYGFSEIRTTTRDLLKFHTALQRGDLLTKAALEKMYAYHFLEHQKEYTVDAKSNYPSYRGLGWCVSKEDPNVVYHSGGSIGGRSFFIRNLEKNQCIIILTNNQEMNRYNFTFPMKILNGAEYQLDPISLPRDFCKIYLKNGIEEAVSFYQENNQNKRYTPFVDFDFEEIGAEMINKRDFKAAIEIYQLYVKAFSDEFSWELLGEAFLLDNNKSKAKSCFEKSLEFNPEYKSALESLAKIK
ncbi:MAG: hypothetical protein Sapg2KO_41470 [Saprospiraceae bacterium]